MIAATQQACRAAHIYVFSAGVFGMANGGVFHFYHGELGLFRVVLQRISVLLLAVGGANGLTAR
jgi:hypothetical protein